MPSTVPNTIVFSARGPVARAAALEAHALGSHVWLAMRDPSLPIDGLSPAEEQAGRYTRIQAEIQDPEQVRAAIAESKATSAFTYISRGNLEACKKSFEVMRQGGVNHVVLLSTSTIEPLGARAALTGQNAIAKVHAEFEIAVEETGMSYSAIRPYYFNSNMWYDAAGLKTGELKLYQPGAFHDYLSPDDIGVVCGARLAWAARQSAEEGTASEIIRLCGPEMLTEKQAWDIVGEVMGRKLTIKQLTRAEYVESCGFPPAVAETVARSLEMLATNSQEKYPAELFKEASGNFKKYTGREPTKLGQWVEKYKNHEKMAVA